MSIEIDQLERKARKLSADDVRKAALARVPKRPPADVVDEPFSEPLVPSLYPENNEAWDAGRVGVSNVPRNARVALTKALDKGNATTTSMLDEYILQMRMAGLRHAEIAARIGAPMTEREVVSILARLTRGMEKTTASEMRMLQVARLEAIINMCWNLAATGSEAHIELLIKTLERLGKVFDLESERSVIEVQYVTDQQTEVFGRAVEAAVEAVMRVYEAKLAAAGIEPIPHEVIEGTVGAALEDASAIIMDAHETPMVLEKAKGGGLQIREASIRPPDLHKTPTGR